LLVQVAGGWTNNFLANEGLSKGNPILGCTPALKPILRRAMGLG
jgi:myo-inositol-1(or 4)-monophosphatase